MSKEIKAGERIRAYRERNDWSVWDLSQKSGVDEKLINDIEKGKTMPPLGVLVKLSRALGQRLGTFMDDQFKPDPIITRAADIEAKKVAGEGMNTLGYASHSLAIGKPDRHMDPFRIEFAADGVDEVQAHEGRGRGADHLHRRRGGADLRPRQDNPQGGRHGVLQLVREARTPRAQRTARVDLRHRVHAGVNESSKVQKFKSSKVQKFKSLKVQKFKSSKVKAYASSHNRLTLQLLEPLNSRTLELLNF